MTKRIKTLVVLSLIALMYSVIMIGCSNEMNTDPMNELTRNHDRDENAMVSMKSANGKVYNFWLTAKVKENGNVVVPDINGNYRFELNTKVEVTYTLTSMSQTGAINTVEPYINGKVEPFYNSKGKLLTKGENLKKDDYIYLTLPVNTANVGTIELPYVEFWSFKGNKQNECLLWGKANTAYYTEVEVEIFKKYLVLGFYDNNSVEIGLEVELGEALPWNAIYAAYANAGYTLNPENVLSWNLGNVKVIGANPMVFVSIDMIDETDTYLFVKPEIKVVEEDEDEEGEAPYAWDEGITMSGNTIVVIPATVNPNSNGQGTLTITYGGVFYDNWNTNSKEIRIRDAKAGKYTITGQGLNIVFELVQENGIYTKVIISSR